MFKIYARAIIKDNSWKILLLKKHANQKYWAWEYMLPGWTLEFGENIEYTLERELKEETNLVLKSSKLIETRKIIIGEEHWLWLYYIVEIDNYTDLKNLEPEKHSFCNFINFSEVWYILHSDIVIKYLDSNYNNLVISKNIYTTKGVHTMWKSIFKYVDIKIHHLLKENNYKYVKIIWQYDRKKSNISKYEKRWKLFNWKRPTAIKEWDEIIIKCFPWIDYIKHYYYLINTYLKINNLEGIITSYELPSKCLLENIFNKYDFSKIKNSDYVILWHIDKIWLFEDIKYKTIDDFKYKMWNINWKKITLLWVEFSIWWDIWWYLIKELAKYSTQNIIYIWKLWTLNKNISPNTHLSTWDNSLVNWKIIKWTNLFENVESDNLIFWRHNTCESIILEDKKWLLNNLNSNFVDPEIWQYAKSANESWIWFSYLHIISDNLSTKYCEDLSNERKEKILTKRKKLFKNIKKILLEKIKN